MPKPEDLKVTSVEEWDEPEGFVLHLPLCGKNVRVKRTLDMMTMIRAGMIPNPLARTVREMISKGATGESALKMDDLNDEALDQMMDLQDRIVCAAVTEPRITMPEPRKEGESTDDYQKRCETWTPEAGSVSIMRLPLFDRQYIAAVAQGTAADVESFREEQAAFVEPVQAGGEVRAKPRRPARSE